MTVGTRIYVARLAGVAVFDPNGEPVGRVRDVVVMFRPNPADRLAVRVEDGDAGEPGHVDPRTDRHGARLPTLARPYAR